MKIGLMDVLSGACVKQVNMSDKSGSFEMK